jgi:peptidoglycan-associated lipoprotein
MNRYFFLLLVLVTCLLSSCKTAKLKDAVERDERGEYFEAAQIYRKVYQKTSSKQPHLRGSIAFYMAECFRKVNNPSRALTGYTNSIRFNYADSTAIFYQAKTLHKLGRYKDAEKQYKAFLELVPNHLLSKNGIIGCELAPDWRKNPTKYVVKRMDKFNSRDGEFSPMFYGSEYDQLYFTSSRKGVLGEDEKSPITGVRNNDFFVVKQDDRKQWLKPERLESGINTELDEGTASFTVDGSRMYYTYCPQEEDVSRSAEIRISNRAGAEWGPGEKAGIFRDSMAMAAHPAVGADGYLYFVSDVMGGYGGKDIWRIPLDAIGFSYPENLGPEINTPGDEMFPYMRSDSILYFSSDGHPGMGGLDIFKATMTNRGKWRVENMQAPINSMGDDFGITFMGKKETGFFSSNRNDARGADHLYSFDLPGVYAYLEGWVLDRDEMEIPGAMVRIVGKDGTNQRMFTRGDGTYVMEVTPGMEYVMMGSAPEFLNQKQTLVVPHIEESETFYVDFYLPSISKPVLIENIFYDFNRATLRPESKEALDEVVTMLADNPNITIELMAHTDRIGSDAYNENLSQRRAQSVVDYLIRAGIDPERLEAKGYGKTTPKMVTKSLAEQYDFLPEGQLLDVEFVEILEPEQQAVADQINRRTEFRVLSTNYRLM